MIVETNKNALMYGEINNRELEMVINDLYVLEELIKCQVDYMGYRYHFKPAANGALYFSIEDITVENGECREWTINPDLVWTEE